MLKIGDALASPHAIRAAVSHTVTALAIHPFTHEDETMRHSLSCAVLASCAFAGGCGDEPAYLQAYEAWERAVCGYLADGPSQAITAARIPANAPLVTAGSHERIDITTVGGLAGGASGGFVTLRLAAGGQFLIAADWKDLAVGVMDPAGKQVSVATTSSMFGCGDEADFIFDGPAGDYTLELGALGAPNVISIVADPYPESE